MIFAVNLLLELRELRDQLKRKWGPDMTELKPSGVETKT